MTHRYDIIVFGGGVAGLFVANRLHRAGYNLIVIEKDKLGGGQTLASQGMIHGGQKYALRGKATRQAKFSAAMADRWEACFAGNGDIDLSSIRVLSVSQSLFPAGGFFSKLATFIAAHAVKGKMRKVKRGPVYEMQEKVLNTKSLVTVLALPLKGRILKGDITELLPDGRVTVSGASLEARAVIFTAGAGNETALQLLNVPANAAQRRPLRQIMVKPMFEALYGHGISGGAKPRVTVTSHPLGKSEYVWYLGGSVAEAAAKMPEAEALRFAKKEMTEIFPHLDWENKEWAGWLGDRAEPFDAAGRLPPEPCIRQQGKILIAWPVKMTFVPDLSDKIFSWLRQQGIDPSSRTDAPPLQGAGIGSYPWEEAAWQRL